jgi:hypothetical protein
MKTPSSQESKKRVQKTELDFTKFKQEPSAEELTKLIGPGGVRFFIIETISPNKTLGRGETSLTLYYADFVQAGNSPYHGGYAHFHAQGSGVQTFFEPIAYGITSVATYIMEFTINVQTGGGPQVTFELKGDAGGGLLLNAGTKVLSSGPTKISLVFQDLPPQQVVSGFLQQNSEDEGEWSWFSTQIRFPDLVLKE